MFEDKTLVCKECGEEFIFTAKEQEFYAEKGFQNAPARCYNCRQARKRNNERGSGRSSSSRLSREEYTATCSACGKEAKVPFKPTLSKPVYCSDCFQKLEAGSGRKKSNV